MKPRSKFSARRLIKLRNSLTRLIGRGEIMLSVSRMIFYRYNRTTGQKMKSNFILINPAISMKLTHFLKNTNYQSSFRKKYVNGICPTSTRERKCEVENLPTSQADLGTDVTEAQTPSLVNSRKV